MWQALKERGLRAEKEYEHKSGGAIDLALLCALGNLGISLGNEKMARERGEWQYLTFPVEAVKTNLPGVVRTIKKTVKELGGVRED